MRRGGGQASGGENIMLSAWLRTHDLASMIREEARGLYPPAADRAAWTALSPEHRQEIRSLEEAYRALPYPLRPASGFLAFAREGSRQRMSSPILPGGESSARRCWPAARIPGGRFWMWWTACG